jgi:translation elongation factor EF-1alpha
MELKVGEVTHYYNRISVAVLELVGNLEIGDRIVILGKTTELTQVVTSMEIEHRKVQSVSPGMDVALKVAEPVRRGDIVYKIVEND